MVLATLPLDVFLSESRHRDFVWWEINRYIYSWLIINPFLLFCCMWICLESNLDSNILFLASSYWVREAQFNSFRDRQPSEWRIISLNLAYMCSEHMCGFIYTSIHLVYTKSGKTGLKSPNFEKFFFCYLGPKPLSFNLLLSC